LAKVGRRSLQNVIVDRRTSVAFLQMSRDVTDGLCLPKQPFLDNEETAGGMRLSLTQYLARPFKEWPKVTIRGRHLWADTRKKGGQLLVASKSLEILAPDKRDACLRGNHGQSISGRNNRGTRRQLNGFLLVVPRLNQLEECYCRVTAG
jgi:hypothetical protein